MPFWLMKKKITIDSSSCLSFARSLFSLENDSWCIIYIYAWLPFTFFFFATFCAHTNFIVYSSCRKVRLWKKSECVVGFFYSFTSAFSHRGNIKSHFVDILYASTLTNLSRTRKRILHLHRMPCAFHSQLLSNFMQVMKESLRTSSYWFMIPFLCQLFLLIVTLVSYIICNGWLLCILMWNYKNIKKWEWITFLLFEKWIHS